jgi:heme A synthase
VKLSTAIKCCVAYGLMFPFVVPLGLFTTWGAGRCVLGYWPRPSLDDPKQIGLWVDIPHTLTDLALMLGLPGFIVAVLALVYCAFRDVAHRKNLLIAAVVCVLCMTVSVAFLRWDPLHAVEWYMD